MRRECITKEIIMTNLKKAKLTYSITLLIFGVIFIVLGILKLTGIWTSEGVRRIIFNIITIIGSSWIIIDFFWTLFSKKRREKKGVVDKIITLPAGLFLLTFDILCFSGVIKDEIAHYFVGGIFLYLSLAYIFQAIYHYYHPLPDILEAARQMDEEENSLIFRDALKEEIHLKEIEELYEVSFPDDEKAPFEYLMNWAKEDKAMMYSVTLKEELIGLGYVVTYKDLAFLFYLAVKKDYQNKGYGTSILSFIKKKYEDKRIILNIEVLDESSENYEQRLKRKAFYEKNEFFDLGYKVKEYVNYYEMFSYQGKKVSKEEYKELFISLVGEEKYKELAE